MNRRFIFASAVGASIFVAAVIGGLDVGPPPNAQVLLDTITDRYASPRCAQEKVVSHSLIKPNGDLEPWTKRIAYATAQHSDKILRPDSACVLKSGISQPVASLLRYGSRWDEQGHWRW